MSSSKKNPKKLFIRAAVLALFAVSAVYCGKPVSTLEEEESPATADDLNPYPNFHGGEVRGEKNFAAMINQFREGKPARPAWAGFFWPYTGNGIASGSQGRGFSPAGKYDAARGGLTKAQDWEVNAHGAGVKGVQGWWGHCNGWVAASALFAEPREPVKVNGIQFSVGDIKGLLSEAGMSASADFFGNRMDPWTREYDKALSDTVPGQFFLVLTNYMGKLRQHVLIDRFTTHEVWNQPVAGYRFKYPTKADYLGCTGSVCKINVEARLWWYNDSGVPADILSPDFDFEDASVGGITAIEHRDLRMELWLDGPVTFDANGKILTSGDVIVTRDGEFFVGGDWKMGGAHSNAWPDYMWVVYSIVKPDPNEDYANPHVDVEWLKAHLLVPGGADDPSVRPIPVPTAPSPRPAPSSSPTTTPSPSPRP